MRNTQINLQRERGGYTLVHIQAYKLDRRWFIQPHSKKGTERHTQIHTFTNTHPLTPIHSPTLARTRTRTHTHTRTRTRAEWQHYRQKFRLSLIQSFSERNETKQFQLSTAFDQNLMMKLLSVENYDVSLTTQLSSSSIQTNEAFKLEWPSISKPLVEIIATKGWQRQILTLRLFNPLSLNSDWYMRSFLSQTLHLPIWMAFLVSIFSHKGSGKLKLESH